MSRVLESCESELGAQSCEDAGRERIAAPQEPPSAMAADRPLTQRYAPTLPPGSRGGNTRGGLVSAVSKGGPAWREGIRAGMRITAAGGQALRDVIDWYWASDGQSVDVEGTAPRELLGGASQGFAGDCETVEFEAVLKRSPGEPWGLEFADAVFDGVRTCVNDCEFCFMRMLPRGMRPALYLRDDDYRLSFLQGNFVTLTNMSDADVARVIEYDLSPLHVSVHAVSPNVRRALIGKNAQRGLKALSELLDAGVRAHAQIVLVPGANDGPELDRTLMWLEERPGVLSVGIVPLGFTRFQGTYDRSFTALEDARAVIEQLRPYQERSRAACGRTRFHLSDEFYMNAAVPLPPASEYDGYPQYEDGIGMLRAFTDAWEQAAGEQARVAQGLAIRASAGGVAPHVVSGEAFVRFFSPLLSASPLAGLVGLRAVANDFFGGNVNVAGLLTGRDILAALASLPAGPVLLPGVMLNDDALTLDGYSAARLAQDSGRDLRMVSCSAQGLLKALGELACA